MSRDWTPQEMHMVDLANPELRNLKIVDAKTGTDMELFKINPKYPNLSFLYGNDFPDTKMSEAAEAALADIIESFDCGSGAYIPKTETETVMFKWYQGELAGGFYYNTENNEMLRQYLWEGETDVFD